MALGVGSHLRPDAHYGRAELLLRQRALVLDAALLRTTRTPEVDLDVIRGLTTRSCGGQSSTRCVFSRSTGNAASCSGSGPANRCRAILQSLRSPSSTDPSVGKCRLVLDDCRLLVLFCDEPRGLTLGGTTRAVQDAVLVSDSSIRVAPNEHAQLVRVRSSVGPFSKTASHLDPGTLGLEAGVDPSLVGSPCSGWTRLSRAASEVRDLDPTAWRNLRRGETQLLGRGSPADRDGIGSVAMRLSWILRRRRPAWSGLVSSIKLRLA